jgi:thiol-disulfide isomerase/thioredoxin
MTAPASTEVPSWVSLEGWDGSRHSLGQGAGGPHLVYFWFTGCPPCVRTTPILAALNEEYAPRGFEILAVNADRVLELPWGDEDRAAYAEEQGITFPLVHATPEVLEAYGSVSVYPTLFFVDAEGVIISHGVNLQERGGSDPEGARRRRISTGRVRRPGAVGVGVGGDGLGGSARSGVARDRSSEASSPLSTPRSASERRRAYV